ncbi:MAG: hypothetical protein DRP91_04025 [Candidatus Neomarinimicrobiota bacterium]|nr:MAG: hypothetical protein DRP91_04025 [Candidatus Neomarinimicrobiota bacterium]
MGLIFKGVTYQAGGIDMVRKNLVATVVLFGLIQLNAQDIELTLERAKAIALENNQEIQMARKEVEKARYMLVEARGNFFPSISAFSSFQHAWELPTVIMNNPFYDPIRNPNKKLYFKMGTENNLVYGFNLQLPIFTGGSIYNGYKIAKISYEIAEAQLKSKEQEVLSNVITAYYNVLFMRSMLKVTTEALEAAEENYRQVKKFYEVGKASEFDLIRAEVQVANYKPQLLSIKNQVKLSEDRLKILLNLDEEVGITYMDSLIFEGTEYLNKDLDTLINIAIENRADVKLLKLQKEILNRQVKLSISSLMPTVAFTTNLQYQGQKDDLDFTSEDFFKSFNSSVSISIPLFTGFRNYAKIQQKKIEVKRFDNQMESFIRAIKLEVKTAWMTLKEAAQNLETQQTILEQAKESYRLANLMYKEGMNTQLDVINAQIALNQSKMNYQRYLLEYNTALVKLLKALNQL